MHRRVFATVLCVAFSVVTTSFAQEERQPPKKPEQPFTIYVFTQGLANESVDMPQVTDEVSKRVAKKKKWLKLVDDRESADLVVEVLTHIVNEVHVRELDTRVNDQGVGKNFYDRNYLSERHRIETRITLPSGGQTMITGVDERKQGGSVKGAASNLAEQLENHCKEHYWEWVAS
jgi:hypothetical protein